MADMLSPIPPQSVADEIAVIDSGYCQNDETASCSDHGSECLRKGPLVRL